MRENRLLGVFCTLLGDEEHASADNQHTAGNVEDGRTDATGGREGGTGGVQNGSFNYAILTKRISFARCFCRLCSASIYGQSQISQCFGSIEDIPILTIGCGCI